MDRGFSKACNHGSTGSPIEPGVDVSGAGDFKAGEAFERTECGNDLLRDDLGRLAESAR